MGRSLVRSRAAQAGGAIITTLALIGCGGQGGIAAKTALQLDGARTKPPLPAEYAVAAKHMTDPLEKNRRIKEPDLPILMAELHTAQSQLQTLRSNHGPLQSAAQESAAAFQEALDAIDTVQRIPQPPGDVEQFILGIISGYTKNPAPVAGGIARTLEYQNALAPQQRRYAAAAHRVETQTLRLPAIAVEFSGPVVVQGESLGIDFDPAWGPVGPDDWLSLTNLSNRELHQCTVAVDLTGRSGAVVRNVHFVPVWNPGEQLHAHYGQGLLLSDQVILRQTLPDVETLKVSIWSDELTQEELPYQYTTKERDADIERYCQGMRFDLHYRPFESGFLWNTERGVVATLRGISRIEEPRITVTFRNGSTEFSLNWEFDEWREDEAKTLDTEGKLSWDPTEVTLEVGFPECGFRRWQTVSVR